MFALNFDKGKKYLKKAGTNVFVIADGIKMVFEPGSAYKDINKEKLPEKFFIEFLNKEVALPKEFARLYQVTHQVDFERLLRGCSILLTNFTGPQSADTLKNHHERLFKHFMVTGGMIAKDNMVQALKEFGKLCNIPKRNTINDDDYRLIAQVLGDKYKLWAYDEIDLFFSGNP
ncbi:MAG: hypothetical protein U9O98_00150 [Asgard group archaeon]|nr:hypothetical protein [Asgard group archaeon]